MASTNSTTKATLREEMKARTWGLHGIADKLLEGALLEKKMHIETFKIYTASLYHIYVALEDAMDKHCNHPQLEAIYFPEVQRREALVKDLEYFYGDTWQKQISFLPPVQQYAEHLTEIGNGDQPIKLAAHAYVRYFGDVSGGQILKRVIARTYSLPADGSGINFYDFSHIADTKEFKSLFTSRLEELDLTPEDREIVAEEAKVAFQHNLDVIRAIDAIIDAEEGRQPKTSMTSVVKNFQQRHLTFLGVSLFGLASVALLSVCPFLFRKVSGVLS